MTENFTTDDELLAELLIAEIPEPGPGYWSVVDELVDEVDAQSSTSDQRELAAASGPAALTDISIECRTGLDEPEPTFLRRLGWPAAIAASLILLIGLVAVVGNRRSANTNDVATDGDDSESAVEAVWPRKNIEHGHSVYGVWDCTLADGAGDWLPHFDSNDDSSGIHSHADGVIHIHPFYDWSAGENAQLGLFATEMRVELSDDALVLEDGSQLGGGAPTCNGEPAQLHVRRWELDFTAKEGADPEIITQNLASARFKNDREVWVIAYAPLDAAVPLPPQERFDTMDTVTNTVYNPAIYPAPDDIQIINGDGPRLNQDHWYSVPGDHWHSVYGVWDCTLADGVGDWLPHFESNTDNSGIHSHDDGLIHVHPFFDWSAGANAQLGLFTKEMGVELSDDALVLADGRRLAEGDTTCDGEPVTLHLRHWDFDFMAQAGETPQIITNNLASARFQNDREVWVIAYAPLDAKIPLPPQERFNLLNTVTRPS